MKETLPGEYRLAFHQRAIARLAPLSIVLALILFPLGWLAEVWRPFGAIMDWLFATVWAHAIGHASLFLLLGLLALGALPALQRRPWRYLALLLLVGVGQELFQLIYKQRPLVFDDARDLVTDLLGALVALVGMWVWAGRASDIRGLSIDRGTKEQG
jgi:hypothetical protein